MSSDALNPQELRLLRASPLNAVDWRFGAILGVSLATHLAFALHLEAQPLPRWSEQVQEERTDRHGTALPRLLPIPKPPRATAAGPRHPSPPSRAPAARPAAELLQREGMLAVLAAHGDKPGGAVDDVLEQATARDVAEAMAGVKQVQVASVDALPGAPKAAQRGEVAVIGRLGADRAGEVSLGGKKDALVTSAVREEPLEPAQGLDVAALGHFLAGRRRAVQLCYERELKHHPTLAGRLVMRLSISPDGRAADVEVEENAMGSDAVASCVRTLMRGWSFPVHPAEEAALSVPYIFSAVQ